MKPTDPWPAQEEGQGCPGERRGKRGCGEDRVASTGLPTKAGAEPRQLSQRQGGEGKEKEEVAPHDEEDDEGGKGVD